MSLTTVNTAVYNFLQGINGITTLYKAAPVRMLGDAWQSGGITGTPAYLHFSETDENRITVPAVHGGQKERTYQFMVVCLYQWIIPNDAADTTGWADGQIQLLDNIIARIESDPFLGQGQGGLIFEGGQQAGGLKAVRGEPTLDPNGGKVMAWCHVEFTVTEIVQA